MQVELNKKNTFDKIKEFCELKPLQERKLEDFILSLLQENQKFNFIGKSTIENIWERHVLDSAQLLRFIKDKNNKFADLGSGAGFPGIILSILGLSEIHLIEKSFRKAEFLRKARLFSNNRIFIHQTKLEDLLEIEFNCIISRALAPMPKLLEYAKKFLKKDGYCLFLKGKNLDSELELAKKNFKFEYNLYPSTTSSESNIIEIYNLK